ncbi:2-oxo acid dehydrogenase subunit E2 [Rhizobiaceae bacterium n13]|uniref:Dihydrolipoamide acetyltransferase component of pyruvate dehydrogenase complex n=1 Tax=Ferirhizobium litorale TaxID=2927786 RepID=A0AAE3QBA8_9HYPH|nr:dihydrolipoamide acetyltransferase family protein [Fererhizobium litorale]MDI7861793.1 2-oxo acid dehydrogenase subunit E2 [Fererhizobium litorale]MDI7921865.1 2-oxo acid dehydrogenase subunit E2 [Fererhizobium litorale]
MTVHVIKLPDIGEGVADAEVVEWMVAVGDLVKEDQLLAAVMTDKATVEIPSPVSGRVVMLGADIGERIAVGGDLISVDTEVTSGKSDAGQAAASPAPQPAAQAPIAAPAAPKPSVAAATSASPSSVAAVAPSGKAPLAAPAVRDRARMLGIDLAQVPATGPEGHVTHEDLDRYLSAGNISARPSERPRQPERDDLVDVKVVGLRRQISAAMAESSRRVAHFAYVEEIDVTEVEKLRASLNADDHGHTKLTLLPFLMRATVRAVRDFPQINAHFDDERDTIQRHSAVHIGVATQTDAGLMVPVVRHAETRDLWDCASEVKRLAHAARAGRALREELTGSTITISSLGALGGIAATPIINRPEVAIIGVNRQVIRPVWQENQFVPRKMMNLSSSFDHRVIDGYDAAAFIQRLKALLEQPALMFM